VFGKKDIWNFWQHAHYERVGRRRAFDNDRLGSAGAKPTWLTELGCPAVDKRRQSAKRLPDPRSSESGLPYFSDGTRDDLNARAGSSRPCRRPRSGFDATNLNPVSSV